MWKRSRITYRILFISFFFLSGPQQTANHIPSLVTPTFRSPDDSIGKAVFFNCCLRFAFCKEIRRGKKKHTVFWLLWSWYMLQLMQLSNCIIAFFFLNEMTLGSDFATLSLHAMSVHKNSAYNFNVWSNAWESWTELWKRPEAFFIQQTKWSFHWIFSVFPFFHLISIAIWI